VLRFYERMQRVQIDLYARKTFKQVKEFEQALEEAIKGYSDLFLESFKADLAKLEEVAFRGGTHYRKTILAKRLRRHIKHIDLKAPSAPTFDNMWDIALGYPVPREFVENNPIGYLYYIWKNDYWVEFKEKLDFLCKVLEHTEYTHREKKFLLLTYHDFIRYETNRFYSFAEFLKEVLEDLQKRVKYKREYKDRYCFVCDVFIDFRSKTQHKHDFTGYKIARIELEETLRSERK